MIFDATLGGRTLRVEVRGKNGRYQVTLDGRSLEVDLEETARDLMSLIAEGQSYEVGLERTAEGYTVVLPDEVLQVELANATPDSAPVARQTGAGPARVMAPMPGKLLKVLVEPGQEVTRGQGLVVVEAMKMENELRSPREGRVTELPAREGQAVEAGALLVVVE